MLSANDRPSVPDDSQRAWQQALRSHPRTWRDNRYVYPVLSRRAAGISVGINLSPDQVCNFQCVYCQVDRTRQPDTRDVDLAVLRAELDHMLGQVASGELFDQQPFAAAPARMRRVSDIAFSGDGEPTASRAFPAASKLVVEARQAHSLPADMRIVVLTNATLLDRLAVQEPLDLLHGSGGWIWAKLDAGTEAHYRRMNRCPIPLRKILDNIAMASKRWRVIIQSMWLRLDEQDPELGEAEAFADRIREMLDEGGRIHGIQVYTIARQPAESTVAPLPEDRLRAIAEVVAERTGVPPEVYPSPA